MLEVYQNPLVLDAEWPHGAPDPYVIKYNGIYYLYVSTDYGRVGVKAWSSINLIDWKYEGLVTQAEESYMAWAPTVVYSNGLFYMYPTTHEGSKNHLLVSTQPTGPFEAKAELKNIDIDSNIFIDDDGQWYLTHAGGAGIIGRTMQSPTEFGTAKTLPGAFLNHWTEGPQLFKRNGLYYLAYTGNHWLSDGYRVNYAISENGPLGDYQEAPNNPLLISTTQEMSGLGNSIILRGPNLDSHYVVYHRLVGSRTGVVKRQINVDRLTFNGRKLESLGPTNFYQPNPVMPDYYSWFDDTEEESQSISSEFNNYSLQLSEQDTEQDFTAEFNFSLSETLSGNESKPELGALISYTDDDNFISVMIDPTSNTVALDQMIDGKKNRLASQTLSNETDYTALQTILIEKNQDNLTVFLNEMEQFNTTIANLSGGKIGYIFKDVTPVMSYTAFTNDVDGSSIYNAYHPVPGTIEAPHYLKEGFYVNQKVTDSDIRQADGVAIHENEAGSYAVSLESKGDWVQYQLNVEEAGDYSIDFLTQHIEDEASIDVSINEDSAGHISINTDQQSLQTGTWSKQRGGIITLPVGKSTLKIELIEGSFTFESVDLYQVTTESINLDNALSDPVTIHGAWTAISNGYLNEAHHDAKLYVGSDQWTDYKVDVDFTLHSSTLDQHGGLLLRVNHESDYGAQVTDAFLGYYIGVNAGQLMLQKVNYGAETIESVEVDLAVDQSHSLTITAVNNQIKVYLNNSDEPLISYDDPYAYLHGKVGIRAKHMNISFENMNVTDLK